MTEQFRPQLFDDSDTGVCKYEKVTSFVSLWNNYINLGAIFLPF